MPSLRCTCGVRWPHRLTEYGKCPECGKRTWYSDDDPVSEDEAASRKKHAEFEQFYKEHEKDQFQQQLTELRGLPSNAPDLPEPVESD